MTLNILEAPQDYELSKTIELCLKDVSWSLLHIQSTLSFSGPVSEVISVKKTEAGSYVIESSLLNMAGTYGPLPYSDTERFLRSHYKEAFRDFLDLFHHRLYAAWYKIETQNPLFFVRQKLKGYLRKRSKEAIRLMLEDVLRLPVVIKPFQGAWISACKSEQSKIGFLEGKYNHLGQDAVLGYRTWKQDYNVRIDIGPMSYKAFCYFLSQEGKKALEKILAPYAIRALFYIYVKSHESTSVLLNRKQELGKTTWMGEKTDHCAYISFLD
jgi:predicted component of type VI protein secretion system